MQRFAGRVAIVTAATRGIGLAIAQRLVDEGGSVVVTGRQQDGVDEAVAALGNAAVGLAGGVDQPEHRAAAIATALERFGRLDHLVNNAGINPAYGPVLAADVGAARKIFEVNVLAAIDWTRDAIAAGLGREPGASVVNTASVAGLGASPGIGIYGVSKAALINLTVQLSAELAPAIRVNAVAPAVVRTRFAAKLFEDEAATVAQYPLGRLGEPTDVAGPVAFLLSSDSAWMTGQTLVIDGGAGAGSLA